MSKESVSVVSAIPKWAIAISLIGILAFMGMSLVTGEPFKVAGFEFGFFGNGGTTNTSDTLPISMEGEFQELSKEVATLRDQYAGLSSKISIVQQDVVGLKADLTDIGGAASAQVRADLQRLSEEVETFRERYVGLSSKMPYLQFGKAEFSWRRVTCGTIEKPCVIRFEREFSTKPMCVVSAWNHDGSNYAENPVIRLIYTDRMEIWRGVEDQGTSIYASWFCVELQ